MVRRINCHDCTYIFACDKCKRVYSDIEGAICCCGSNKEVLLAHEFIVKEDKWDDYVKWCKKNENN